MRASRSNAATAGPSRPTGRTVSVSRSLALEFGDTYEGSVEVKSGVSLPHGEGTWRSADGQLRYVGHFVQRWRDGYGRLCTPTFTLWARWRMDRPDLSSSTRVDYPNGDRYCGFVEWKVKGPPTATTTAPRSKFSAWAASVEPTRQRWGELVMASGDVYVGEWRDNEREGFGCYVWASGSRYTGRFHHGQFSDTGTLFVAPAEVDGCLSRLSCGGWVCGGGLTKSRLPTAAATSSTAQSVVVSRWPPSSRRAWDGMIVDVVWADGRCRGEGHVTLPSGVRISADWRTASSPQDGELVLPALTPQARMDPDVHEWHESFQWESLLNPSGSGSSTRHAEAAEKVLSTRVSIQRSNSAEVVKSCVVELLSTHDVVKAALHVFRRCFYGLYGTCGVDSEMGAGGAGNALGWCTLRNMHGGCIHPARGRCIQAGDLDLALRDIASLARSTVRWLLEAVGAELQTKVLDCGGEAVVGRWVADRVFQQCYPVLLNLYNQVYRAEETALSAAVARLRDAVTLDDMGVVFARQSESQAKLFDPYTDAVHCVEQLNKETQTLTELLKVLVQWSREIDLSTRLTQASQDPPRSATAAASGTRTATTAAKSTAGSADDLLPIHQYVLSQSRCPHLYAVTRLLADFSGEPLFMEATSQEAFGVTTLQACVLTLLRLHPWERDDAGILVPFSVAMDRVEEAVQRRTSVAAWVLRACARGTGGVAAEFVDAAQLATAMTHYAAVWVPRAVGWVGEQAGVAGAVPLLVEHCAFEQEELAVVHLRPSLCGEAICFGCWLYAGLLLSAAHVELQLGTLRLPQQLHNAESVAEAVGRLREHLCEGTASLQLRLLTSPSMPLIPSRMLRLEARLSELLSGA